MHVHKSVFVNTDLNNVIHIVAVKSLRTNLLFPLLTGLMKNQSETNKYMLGWSDCGVLITNLDCLQRTEADQIMVRAVAEYSKMIALFLLQLLLH